MIEWLKKFFRQNLSEIIGAYFDGEKIFVVRLTKKFETVEIDADGSEPELLAEKISLVCTQKGWKTSSVGFCLQAEDAVTFQTEVGNIPEKEIPALVKSWAVAQAGAEAAFSFTKVGEELWMETLPRAKVEDFRSAFKKFNMNLRGLSVMPVDMLAKVHPYDRTEFITEIIRNKQAPNLLSARGGVWNWQKISLALAAIFFIGLLIGSVKLLLDYHEASDKLDAAKTSIEELHADIILKETIDDDIAELHRLNNLAAQIDIKNHFNLLINIGKISGGDVRLTKISIEENILELESATDNPDAVKNYLSRVKSFVAQSARLESSKENDDGDIIFLIRAAL